MLKLKRTIYVNERSLEIWLGLISKNGKYSVFLLTDSPDRALNHAEKILSGIDSKNEAIKQGIMYAKNLFKTILADNK